MKFGILGEAKIAREHVVPAILNAGHEVTHVGRRDPGKVALPDVYGDAKETDYESLIKDPSVEAIYNPLPNHLHAPYSIEALKNNKHVLVYLWLRIMILRVFKTPCFNFHCNFSIKIEIDNNIEKMCF